MKIGSIRNCNYCGVSSYIKAGINKCPECGEDFRDYPVNKAPAGWIKMENYEISRKNVETMLKTGELTMEDLRR